MLLAVLKPSDEDLQRMVNALAQRAGYLSGLPGKTISAGTAVEVAASASALVHAIWPVVCSVVLEAAAKVCDGVGHTDHLDAPGECAARIRALKGGC